METLNETTATATADTAFKTELLRLIKEDVKDGELYIGIMLDMAGQPSHHLVLSVGDVELESWDAAVKWAADLGCDLPTRAEQALLFANAKIHFAEDWYWSNTQHATLSDYAWYQSFYLGGQDNYNKSGSCRARAVRRLPI